MKTNILLQKNLDGYTYIKAKDFPGMHLSSQLQREA
jgi:hypothetical protein